jgi:hypothetical protein
MHARRLSLITILVSTFTIIVSCIVAYKVTGSPLGTVPILKLAAYGALSYEALKHGEWWTLLSAQLVPICSTTSCAGLFWGR